MTRATIQLPTQGGILLVDKLGGWTSHDVVAKSRRALGTRKVGHAGTLDPMATGLLVLGAGPATRLLTHLVGLDKEYTATIRLGVTTVTDDREGETVATASAADIDDLLAHTERISEEASRLTGEIEQAPSAVSAIKVGGKRAYDRVRAGEQVELAKRPVTVHRFEVGPPRRVELESGPVIDLDVEVQCGSGTYVRALARDLGEQLGIGGHLTALRRTAVGPFSVREAVAHEALISAEPPEALAVMRPASVAARLFTRLDLTEAQGVDLGHGKRVQLSERQLTPEAFTHTELAAAIAPDGRLVGLVSVREGRVKPVTNFPTPDAGGAA